MLHQRLCLDVFCFFFCYNFSFSCRRRKRENGNVLSVTSPEYSRGVPSLAVVSGLWVQKPSQDLSNLGHGFREELQVLVIFMGLGVCQLAEVSSALGVSLHMPHKLFSCFHHTVPRTSHLLQMRPVGSWEHGRAV